jgi:hypothetical protein
MPADILTLPAKAESIGTLESYALRFYAPEKVRKNELTYESMIWSFGCLVYEVFHPLFN